MAAKLVFPSKGQFRFSFLILIFIVGCDSPRTWIVSARKSVKSKIENTFHRISEAEAPAKVLGVLGYRSERAQKAKVNTEVLYELYQVVTQSPPQSRDEFSGLVDALNQGASIEGVYNGFVFSSSYRNLEKNSSELKPEALIAFAKEVALLRAELPEPDDLSEKDAEPLAVPVNPGSEVEVSPRVVVFDQKSNKTSYDARVMSLRYAKIFSDSSIFTLKRLLGKEILAVIDAKKSDPEKLASWYSKWVVHMNKYKIDYGLQLRNISDEKFHHDWVMKASRDMLVWEVLNRVHRLMNELNRGK